VAVEEFVCYLSVGALLSEFERLRAEPLHADYGDKPVGQNAAQGRVRCELFELGHDNGSCQRVTKRVRLSIPQGGFH
jgi:hypothetical protein